jgi:ketosteroid isomerase-like protein
MKTMILLALVACAGNSVLRAQWAASDPDAKSKIVAMEQVWNQAFVLKDSKALDTILDDRFVNVESDGRLITKGDMLAEVKGSTALQIFTESTEVHVHGDTAIATGVFRIKGVQQGKPFAERARFVDTWLLKNGQWVTIAGVVTPIGE